MPNTTGGREGVNDCPVTADGAHILPSAGVQLEFQHGVPL